MNKMERDNKHLVALARTMPTWDDFIIEEFKKDSEFMRGAVEDELQEYAQTGDMRYLLATLRDVATAKGWVWLAKETGLSRPTLYEALYGRSKPKFETITKILNALGFKILFVTVDDTRSQSAKLAQPPRRPARRPVLRKAQDKEAAQG